MVTFTVNTDDGEEGYKTITMVTVVGVARTTALLGADHVPGPVLGAAHTFSHLCFFTKIGCSTILQRRNVLRMKFY